MGGSKGFTLIELLVVIVIIGVLATIAAVNLHDRDQPARVAATRTVLKDVSARLAEFRMDHHRYPRTLEDLVFRPEYVDSESWRGGYFQEIPLDGWQNDLVYRVPGSDDFPFDVVSTGADGKPGGSGYDADLWNHARRDSVTPSRR